MGDIRHSRVAHSAYEVFSALGLRELRLVGPAGLMPEGDEFPGAKRYHSPEEGLRGADVVMMLRIQRERMAQADIPDGEEYFARYGLTAPRLRLARPDAIVMHPQPMNRGVEIDSEVADGPQSVIRDQVRNGVAVRMAVLEAVLRPARDARMSAAADALASAAPRAHRGTIHIEDGTIVGHIACEGRQYVLRIQAPRTARRATPGSFVHLRCDP